MPPVIQTTRDRTQNDAKQLPTAVMSVTKLPAPIVIGVAVRYQHEAMFGVYVHDTLWTCAYGKCLTKMDSVTEEEAFHAAIVGQVRLLQLENNCKVIIMGLAMNGDLVSDPESPNRLRRLARVLWFEADVLPCIRPAVGLDLDDLACSVSRKALHYLEYNQIPGIARIGVGQRHEVEVDGNGALAFAILDDYKRFCRPETWAELIAVAERVKKSKKSIVFFNSTPRGGGVAIIRHSTIRLCRLLGIDAHWFAMKPNPDVFVITKKKFHNVLQGVASDTWLTEDDERKYLGWCLQNVDRYWADPDGHVANASVVVIDDPQPSGMIKRLKEINRQARFVYRSHIEIRSDLLSDSSTTQAKTWSFLWNSIRLCDVFVSHPIERFIPDDVRKSGMQILKMPAITDPTDGLNKPLDDYALNYYHLLFNRIAFDNDAKKLIFSRPYFLQISRFDPSKGIPDLLDAYVAFRRSPAIAHLELQQVPQLIVAGHGSIDDPEGATVLKEINLQVEHLATKDDAESAQLSDNANSPGADVKAQIKDIVRDIHVVRLPASDRTLNAILRTALAAFQMSHREGFEIKVTEALLKGVPVVAYAAGGIPLQVRHEVDGLLLPIGDIGAVADAMRRLVCDPGYRARLSENARSRNREEFLTPCNLIKWCKVMLGEEFPTHPEATESLARAPDNYV